MTPKQGTDRELTAMQKIADAVNDCSVALSDAGWTWVESFIRDRREFWERERARLRSLPKSREEIEP